MAEPGQWIIVATLIITSVVQYLREKRNRRWDKEDREEQADKVAEKVVAEAHLVAKLVIEEAKAVAVQANMERSKIVEAIQENTEISTKAFEEANTINQKIASLGIEHNTLQREKQENDDNR
jgi:hypothetical protein